MIQTEIQPEPIVEDTHPDPSPAEAEVSVLDILVLLLERKRFIVRFVVGAAVLAAIVSLLLPVQYEAKIALLPPSSEFVHWFVIVGTTGRHWSIGLAGLSGRG